jgi:hypothetical protein
VTHELDDIARFFAADSLGASERDEEYLDRTEIR